MSLWGSAEIGHVIIANSSLDTLVTQQVDYVQVSLALNYTLRKEVVTTPFEAIKSIWIEFLCFQWAKIGMKLLPNKIRPYLDWTFNSMPSGIKVQNRSWGGHFPKSAFALWQIGINNCIYFSHCSLIVLIMPHPTSIVIGMKCLRLPVRACGKALLLVALVWLVLPLTAYSWGMLPLESSCQARPRGLLGRPHLVKTMLCSGWSNRIAQALTVWMRNLYGMRAGRKTINNWLLSRGHHAYKSTRKPLLGANCCRLCLEWAQIWQNLTMAHWQHVVFGDESRFQVYLIDGRLRVPCLPG